MSALLLGLGGLLARHALTVLVGVLGTTLAQAGLAPDAVKAALDLVNTVGVIPGLVIGLVMLGGAVGWSYWQKHKSGALLPK